MRQEDVEVGVTSVVAGEPDGRRRAPRPARRGRARSRRRRARSSAVGAGDRAGAVDELELRLPVRALLGFGQAGEQTTSNSTATISWSVPFRRAATSPPVRDLHPHEIGVLLAMAGFAEANDPPMSRLEPPETVSTRPEPDTPKLVAWA